MSMVFAKSIKIQRNKTTEYGLNYFSTHNHYEPYYLTDEILDRDFSLFRKNGINYITLELIWKYLEPSLGEYNDPGLEDIVRVCRFAEKYRIKIIINFYTMMHENTFTMPEWVSPRKFEQIFLL